MRRLDLYASQPHYLDHLAPLVEAMQLYYYAVDVRMLVTTRELVERAAWLGVAAELGLPRLPGAPTLVASWKDAETVHKGRRLALLEHGVGQTYVDLADRPEYPGGPGWERCSLFLVPGPHAAARWSGAYPHAQVATVGCPKLDRWFLGGVVHGVIDRPTAAPPTVAFTFHWPCRAGTETGTAFDDWSAAIESYVEHASGVEILGHWHPKWGDRLRRWWPRAGVAPVEELDAVMGRADVLVADNTSAMYEFAATGRPVLCLDASKWRREVEHGLRFWRHAPGFSLAPGDDLEAGIDIALRDHEYGAYRRDALAEAYGPTLDGRSCERAAVALREWLA